MLTTYNHALRRVLADEGGFSNHPSDPGGPTNYGITIHDFRRYIDPHGDVDDLLRLTIEQAGRIYHAHYWNPVHGDELPAGLDYTVFDYGVNSGVARALKVLNRIARPEHPREDWPQLLAAINRQDPETLIRAINAERMHFLHSLRTWRVFGKGWAGRVNRVLLASLALAAAAKETTASQTPTVGKGTT